MSTPQGYREGQEGELAGVPDDDDDDEVQPPGSAASRCPFGEKVGAER